MVLLLQELLEQEEGAAGDLRLPAGVVGNRVVPEL
jgi:hypothetical protein